MVVPETKRTQRSAVKNVKGRTIKGKKKHASFAQKAAHNIILY